MTDTDAASAGQVVLPCAELEPTLSYFVDLGFRLDMIFPADDPRVAVVSGPGLAVRLDTAATGDPGHLRLPGDGPRAAVAPNGTRIDVVPVEAPLVVPTPTRDLVITHAGDDARWVVGRAGMRYRDLIPGRLGGSFIASHIHVPDAGPVPDYVHYHDVRFQMIHCVNGWVRLVYEDQGPPFVLHAGECVLQPPGIRHRVLECSADLDVVEIGSPAEHMTLVEHEIELPTATERPDRDFGGQRFTRHDAATATWQAWHREGFEQRDLGIGAATDGLAGARVVRPRGQPASELVAHGTEFQFLFVLTGSALLRTEGHPDAALSHGDAVSVPGEMRWAIEARSTDLELLDVTLPAVVTPR